MAVGTPDQIREMISRIREERVKLLERDALLEAREETLLDWLAEEEGGHSQQASLAIEEEGGLSPLLTFLSSQLEDGQARSTAELADLARKQPGLIGRRKSPMRVVNISMQTLRKYGFVKQNGDGGWVAKK